MNPSTVQQSSTGLKRDTEDRVPSVIDSCRQPIVSNHLISIQNNYAAASMLKSLGSKCNSLQGDFHIGFMSPANDYMRLLHANSVSARHVEDVTTNRVVQPFRNNLMEKRVDIVEQLALGQLPDPT